ncbi:heparinase II/III family protein [Streptococcus didelphis]|uniref:heparinase II/III family protein n=1 Tax=Streptococcus didelphis TaxID=102886 RepID=UPI0027D2F192|nr:heparinase II/III family protein [Streptococcus didelphis]WMB29736.1 heparinase II/III family protein [Streptococcus didelphis]
MDKKIDEKVANFFKDFDEDFCRQYILEKDFEAYQKLKSSLDKMMTNTFIFDDNWDMEPCSTPYHLDPLSWDRQVSEDKEWNYMLNRQGYLMKFILVYLVEKDSRYLDKVKYFIFHWIDCHYPLKADSLVSRTLDTGIRSFTWLKVILYLLYFEAINQEELDKIIRSLAQQLTFLQENYKAKYSLSNWGILQITAILACLFYFEKEINLPHLKVFAETELEEQLRLQILDDGSQYEQSIMYHVEVYRALLDLAVFAPEYKPQLETKLEEMAYYIYMMTGSDHCQLAFGDSDVTDTRDILTASAIFFQSKVLKSYAYPYLDRESLLLFGKKGVAIFEKLESVEPASIEANHFASSGHICHRDSRRYLFFKCGPFGSAHSHSDLNSFCLYDQGKPIFIDPGRFTYQEEKGVTT